MRMSGGKKCSQSSSSGQRRTDHKEFQEMCKNLASVLQSFAEGSSSCQQSDSDDDFVTVEKPAKRCVCVCTYIDQKAMFYDASYRIFCHFIERLMAVYAHKVVDVFIYQLLDRLIYEISNSTSNQKCTGYEIIIICIKENYPFFLDQQYYHLLSQCKNGELTSNVYIKVYKQFPSTRGLQESLLWSGNWM